MVTERHRKQPQMRGIGSNEAASRIDTRMMMHRLVAIFPYMCAPHKTLADSDAATRRAGNKRFKHMHRRSRASKIAPE